MRPDLSGRNHGCVGEGTRSDVGGLERGAADGDPRKTHVAALYGAAAGFGGWASRDAVSRRKGKRGIPSPLR